MKTHPTHKVVCFGEVLWDLLPGAALPGGAPMNVTYHLHKLGLQPALITKVGKDEEGAELVRIFKAHGVGTGYFQWDEVHETGKVYAQLQENNEVTYDIVKPSAWDYIEWSNDLEKLVADAPYFVFGSLAARSEVSKNTLYRLLDIAATKVLDINLRAPHYTKQGVEELLYKADILKLNKAELELVSGWLGPYNNLKDRVAAVADAYQLETVVITSGSEGAYLYKEGTGFHHPGFAVTVKDTIGSGDAFLAGLLAGFVENRSPAQALAFANAMGAFMATQPGGCPAYDISEVQLLSQTGNI